MKPFHGTEELLKSGVLPSAKVGKAALRTMELEVRKWDLFALSLLSHVLPGHHSQPGQFKARLEYILNK